MKIIRILESQLPVLKIDESQKSLDTQYMINQIIELEKSGATQLQILQCLHKQIREETAISYLINVYNHTKKTLDDKYLPEIVILQTKKILNEIADAFDEICLQNQCYHV